LTPLSLTPDNSGCPVVVFESKGPGNVQPTFARKMTGRVAVTNEGVNGYNALAAADLQGKILTGIHCCRLGNPSAEGFRTASVRRCFL
jgi:hypothetical protein